MCLVFRPSKLHPSSSGLTVRSCDRYTTEKTTGKIRPAEAETDLSFQWRALTPPTAFIFCYGERMMRKTEVKRASARLVSPFNRAFGIRSSDFIKSRFHAAEERRGEKKRKAIYSWIRFSFQSISFKTLLIIRSDKGNLIYYIFFIIFSSGRLKNIFLIWRKDMRISNDVRKVSVEAIVCMWLSLHTCNSACEGQMRQANRATIIYYYLLFVAGR